MDNSPTEEIVLPVQSITLYENADGIWIIRDEKSGVTTQGESREEALLMLIDATLDAETDPSEMVELSQSVFHR
jgi:hypothetical protein